MLKKIKVDDVRLGMYLQEVCGSWMDHPFWKGSFKLTEDKDLNTLKNCGVDEVWIDTSKGLDVDAGVAALSQAEGELKVESELKKIEQTSQKTGVPVSLQVELIAAKKIHTKTKEAVVSMFSDVRMGNALQLDDALSLVDEINQSIARNSSALVSLSRLKNVDDYTYLHSVAVCVLMMALGRQLGLEGEVLKQAGLAGLMHDLGKVFIPHEVLNKPGKLTEEEFNIVKMHPLKGWEFLKKSSEVSDLTLDVCRHHHERVDGKGYPDKLSGEALTLFARMGAICDVYDAITSNRCYKKGWEPAESIRKMAEWKDGHFDEAIFHAFVKTVGIYPTGTLLKLKSGRLGVVTDQSQNSLTKPLVKVFFSTRSNAPILPETIDLSKSPDSIANIENPLQWGFDLDKITGV
ncbi:Cyclic di-GMP phosphodiesterase [Candidatus Nitrotoga sp. HW29]|uniref:HD-GYP domain-containing protein n=1 Tax=Candidatus Nitrotoga sp. HW29 TaxID=2886963 RepID=UPI001EF26B3F|nr:HD-GYP domain-containing protein [Candidatus Nitrotoga sp. HW29]CAH1906200.1 Cyclic di-GMP phosphodiesterase [Candidatus Nitrotoga sp. HW29]